MSRISANSFIETYGASKDSPAAICACGLIATFREGEHWYSCYEDGRRYIEVAFKNIDTLPLSVRNVIYEYIYNEVKDVVYCSYVPMAYIEDIIGTAGGITTVGSVEW